MSETLDPRVLFRRIAEDVPSELHPHLLVVGSLAAAYHHRERLERRGVNTKDADVVIRPAGAVDECRRIALRLLEGGWERHESCHPSQAGTPTGKLRAIRLHPPGSRLYFLEFLAFPASGQQEGKLWVPCELADGWYGLPSFRFMGVTGIDPQPSDEGLSYAQPSMMALANLLSHPRVGPERMSAAIGGRFLRRASKDLGRVLALARLDSRDDVEAWADRWSPAVRATFGNDARIHAATLGNGLRELLGDPGLLEEARHATDVGLLSGLGVTTKELRAVGDQLLFDVIEPVERAFEQGASR